MNLHAFELPGRHAPRWRRLTGDGALVACVLLLGWCDAFAAGKIRLTALLLVPIMLLTWRRGAGIGYCAVILALGLRVWADAALAPPGSDLAYFEFDAVGRFVAFFVIVAILAHLRSAHLRLQELAIRDALTGLYNRSGLSEIMRVEMDRAIREGCPLALLFIDCDNFKTVNDTLGHAAGDQALQRIASVLLATIRASDIASRLGGDEFVVVASGIAKPELLLFAEKMRASLRAAMESGGWNVTFSIGAVTFDRFPASVGEAIGVADSLMYQVKQAGKSGIRIASWPASPTGAPIDAFAG